MKKFPILFLALAAAAAPLFADVQIGRWTVQIDTRTLAVRVSANTPELDRLAQLAFDSDGRYRLVSGGGAYDIRFERVGAAQVRVDVTKGVGGSTVVSETVSGDTARDALLRAADVAVEHTNREGLRGYFASRLAFISERTGHKEVYAGDLFFGGLRYFNLDGSIAMNPRWSPDGQKIVYTSFYHSGFPDIFMINLASDTRTVFASFRGTNSGARFSPDGRQVAMVLSGAGTPDIYVGSALGGAPRRLTHSDAAKASPCWSPDGSRIVFASEPGPQLYLISAAGGTPRRLTHNISLYCAEPDWSRTNPNKIAFTIKVGANYQIAVYDFSKDESAQVSHAPFDGISPCWLPDGRHLVYTARNSSTSRLCILDTETGNTAPISPASFGACSEANVLAR